MVFRILQNPTVKVCLVELTLLSSTQGVHGLNIGWDNGYYDKLFVVFPKFSNANTGKVHRVGHDRSFPNSISSKIQK